MIIRTKIPESADDSEFELGPLTFSSEVISLDDGGDGIYKLNGNMYYTKSAAERVARSIKGWSLPWFEDIASIIEFEDENFDYEQIVGVAKYGFGEKCNGKLVKTAKDAEPRLVDRGKCGYYWTDSYEGNAPYIWSLNKYGHFSVEPGFSEKDPDNFEACQLRLIKGFNHWY